MKKFNKKNHQKYITSYAKILHEALIMRGVDAILEYPDGHKCVDIAILDAKIYIELDGLHHYTKADQILSDFGRNYYSDRDGFNTIHIPNIVLEKCLNNVVKAIVTVVKKRCSNQIITARTQIIRK